jgi:ribosomal RNA-processing protein 12
LSDLEDVISNQEKVIELMDDGDPREPVYLSNFGHSQSEIFTTLLVFLTSANREIVKSTLGYIKLSIHTLPADLLKPYLKDLVPALLRWSHNHKNHFKAKVWRLFERMLRRFGWNGVYFCAGEEEATKVLVNIKKRKEWAKRKKNVYGGEEEDYEEVSALDRIGTD